jgi:hypothetical protein
LVTDVLEKAGRSKGAAIVKVIGGGLATAKVETFGPFHLKAGWEEAAGRKSEI